MTLDQSTLIAGAATLGSGAIGTLRSAIPGCNHGLRISWSCWMALFLVMDSVVEVGMVAPRDWRTLVACNTVRLACDMDGVVQYVGYSRHVSAMRYLLVAGM
jgi:hypothetical protein